MDERVLDRAGCEFGRANREKINSIERDFHAHVERGNALCDIYEQRFQALEEEMRKLDDRLDTLQARLSWILGAAAAGGAIIGTFLSAILTHIVR